MSQMLEGRLDGFAHTAVLYGSDAELTARVVPYLLTGLTNAEHVVAVVSPAAEAVLRSGLGAAADRVEWSLPESVATARMGQRYEAFRRYIADRRAAGVRTRVVGQHDDDLAGSRLDEHLRYDAAANESFAPYDTPVMCLWDVRRHDGEVLRRVRECHPHLVTSDDALPVLNADYRTPADFLSDQSMLPPEPPVVPDMDRMLARAPDLASMRAALRTLIAEVQIDADEIEAYDVVLAANEVASNGLLYGGPPVRVRAWSADHTFYVRIDDPGSSRVQPLDGYVRPTGSGESGRGLWIARQAADVVTVHPSSAGTAVVLAFPDTRGSAVGRAAALTSESPTTG